MVGLPRHGIQTMIDRKLRDRYSRQTAFAGIGEGGQARLLKGKVIIIGCGALGCNIAALLARAGVGNIRIVDRDFIEYHNLQRQVLFDEDDVRAQLPKAIAAERHLRKVNSTIEVQGIVADVNFTNIEKLCRGADVILDGLDNFETRLLINDVALKHGIPWVYGSAIASSGMTMTIIPPRTPCFRCLSPVFPESGTAFTCETAGIVGAASAIIGALQATEAMKLLIGTEEMGGQLTVVDVWEGTCNRLQVRPRKDCPACRGKYEFLDKTFAVLATSLCGQSRAVQVVDGGHPAIDLDKLAARLKDVSNISRNEYKLSFQVANHEIIVFPDGRAIIKNTTDEPQAKELYARYVRNPVVGY